MNNQSFNETDTTTSDEINVDTYSTGERWIIFIVIYIVSLILCIVYLFLRTDYKQFSLPIFILCLIYSSFFVMLNVMAMFDLIFSNEKGMIKFFEMVSIFYEIFNWIDKILGYVVFNLLIGMMESGYFSMGKKFFYYLIKIWKSIPKKLFEIIIRLVIAIATLVILIVFRKRFDLGNNPFDYFSIILDVFGMYEIYTNVGFFMFQLILDYRRKKDQIKINRYDSYSKIKIIENIEKYMEKVKDSYNKLKKDANIFEKNDQPDYHKYLQKVYKEMEQKVKEYGLEVNDEERKEKVIEYGFEVNNEENNLDFNNNNTNDNNINYNVNNKNVNDYNINNNQNNNNNVNNNTYIFSGGSEIDSKNKIAVQVQLNRVDSQKNRENNREQRTINDTECNNDKQKEFVKVKEEDFDTNKNIKKFKNAVRRIKKLKQLYHEITEETNVDLNRLRMNKKCSWRFVILFIAFSIALLTDILLPIAFDPEDDFTKSAEGKHEKFDSIGALILGIILSYPFSVIVSSYTVIMIYSTNRKNYISGDYLYDKQINDNISLLKTVQIICGYSFSILYCNLYFWRTIDTHGHYGKPKFYETTFIPDYTLKQGITIFMIVKIILIGGSIFGSYFFSSCSIFQNDLNEFNRSGIGSIYDNQMELNRIYQEKFKVFNFLNNKT